MKETDVVHYECECPICGQKVGIGFYKGTRVSVIRMGKITCGRCGMHFIPVTDKEKQWKEWKLKEAGI